MPDESWNPHRDALIETCDKPECEYCTLGVLLLRALNDARVTPGAEMLTMERAIAATITATVPADKRAKVIDMIVDQLRDDVALLLTPEEAKEWWH